MDILYKKTIGFALCLFLSQLAYTQETFSKTIHEKQELSNAGEVTIDNRYGDVRLYGWDQNTVDVSVDIRVTHKKREVAENLLTRVASIVSSTNDRVTIRSEITDKESTIFSKYFGKANSFSLDGSNVQINYTIYLPKNSDIVIANKFGSVFIENWTGKLRADVQHGDIWIQDHLNNVDIDLKYGKLKVPSINYGNIRLKNGDLDIETGKDLRINSSGSELRIKHIVSLELYANRDDIRIGSATSIVGDLKFTTLTLEALQQKAKINMKIADLRINRILSADAELDLTQESSEISLNIHGFSFKFNATVEEGLVRIPTSFKDIDSHMLDQGKRIRRITATYGQHTQGLITIHGNKGLILLKE